MSRARGWRALAAVITAMACVVMMSGPAAAVVHQATSSDGAFRFTKTGMTPEWINVGSWAAVNCLSVPRQIDFDVNGVTLLVSAIRSRDITTFAAGGTYLVVITRSTVANTAGSIVGTVVTGLRVGVVVEVYDQYTSTDCEPTAGWICRFAFALNVSGTLTSATSSGIYNLTGTGVAPGVVAFPSCTAGPTHLLGSSADTGLALTGTLTT